jgi:starch synthase
MDKMKVLYVTSEAAPFITTGGLGEVAGSLPKALKEKYGDNIDIRIIMPLYQNIWDRSGLELVCKITVPLAWREQYCAVFQQIANDVIYYFIDNEYYFKRGDCYGHYDDGERFAYFSKAVLSILSAVNFIPDIIHINDWQSALIPVYLKTKYLNEEFKNIKTILTIHNIEYQGVYDLDIAEDVFELYDEEKSIVEFNGAINILKGAMETCDIISTVSESYSKEIFDDYYAHGLASIINKNTSKVKGILNGIDTEYYNPETDMALFENYSKENIEIKYSNKSSLQMMSGLPVDKDVPVIAIISRLVKHKGIDLIIGGIEDVLKERVQFIILGKGDRSYELKFKALQEKYHDKISVRIDFNSNLARKLYAGADFLLMPSISEPCGIAQMIASRYGTVPIVRETGGLKDSIKDYGTGIGNGFTFYEQTSEAMVDAVKRALSVYRDKDGFRKLVQAVISTDFTWERSAKEYFNMYKNLLMGAI